MTLVDPRRLYVIVAEWPGGRLVHHVADDEHAALYAQVVTRMGLVPADAWWSIEPW